MTDGTVDLEEIKAKLAEVKDFESRRLVGMSAEGAFPMFSRQEAADVQEINGLQQALTRLIFVHNLTHDSEEVLSVYNEMRERFKKMQERTLN